VLSRKPVLLVVVIAILASCAGPTPSVSPLGTSPVATPISKLSPAGKTILEKETPWNDPRQRVVVYQNENRQSGFRVLSSGNVLIDFPIPAGETFADIIFSGDESNSAREIGFITHVGDDSFQARVYNINLGVFVPEKGTGNITYASVHVPPFLADLDNDTVPELVVAFDDANLPSGFVNSRIYVLSDNSYTKSDFLILPPRELSTSN
jgi:hypothetical protein